MGPGLQTKKRLLAILSIFSLIIICLLIRVIFIQFIQNDFLVKRAYDQYNTNRALNPRRGTIYDRNMKELAISASVEVVSVNPPEFKTNKNMTTEKVAEDLAQIIGSTKEIVLKKLTAKSRYEIIKRKVDKEVGDAVRKWQKDNRIEGINVDEDSKRFYPNRNLAAHVIGFTGSDNQGLDGIERTMDEYLKGVKGKILNGVDAKGKELPLSDETYIEAQDGLNVVLTIDETIQHLADKALEKAVVDNKLQRGAMAVVIQPKTGDILALVSKPDFDLNTPFAVPPGEDPNKWNGYTQEDLEKLQKSVWRNKVIADTYEPGSTFKAITSSAGLEEKEITPETQVTDATINVGGWNIKCWKPNAHLHETFTEGVYNSCNPVFVRLSQKLGIERFYKYLRAFGFYDKTNIDLLGEAKSNIHKKPAEIDMASASFGQRFTITPIQLITAYACIANGGNLIKPRLVKELTDSNGNVVKKFDTQVVRNNVISKETADTVKEILEGVVSIGTGKNAYVPGFRIAGKTGTSETTEKKRYIASFSAIAPADDPQICALVILDYPDVYPHTGGMIAAPVAGKLVGDILTYLEVERKYSEKDKKAISQDVFVPDLRNKTIEEAKKILKEYNLNYKIEPDSANGTVMEQTPKPDAAVKEKSVIMLYTYKPEAEITVKMPDLNNKTVDDATQTLAVFGLNIKVNGGGIAVSQKYKVGSDIPKGSVVDVEFRHITDD